MNQDERTELKYAPNLTKLAEALGIGGRTAARWHSQGAPGREPSGYSLEAWRAWQGANVPYRARRGERSHDATLADGPGGGDRKRLLRAQADERRSKADLAGLKLAIERGDLIAKTDIEAWDRSRIAIVRRGLLGLGRQVAPLVAGLTVGEIEALIARETKSLLTRFLAIKR